MYILCVLYSLSFSRTDKINKPDREQIVGYLSSNSLQVMRKLRIPAEFTFQFELLISRQRGKESTIAEGRRLMIDGVAKNNIHKTNDQSNHNNKQKVYE